MSGILTIKGKGKLSARVHACGGIAAILKGPNGATISGVSLDAEMVGVSVVLSLIAGLLAGIYPAWRICSIAPAMQLKLQ